MSSFEDRGLQFRVAQTAEDQSALAELCAEVYRAQFGGDPIGDPAFEQHSVWLGAWQGARAVGCMRYVADSELGLPLEAASHQSCRELRAQGRPCEMGRFAVPRSAGFAPFILLGLLRLSFWQALEHRARYLLTCAPQRIWSLYSRMQLKSFGEPFQHPAGELFVLGALDLKQLIERVYAEGQEAEASNFLLEILRQRSNDEDLELRRYLLDLGSS